MQEYKDTKAKAWKEHAARFECDHQSAFLRRRVVRGGGAQYVKQCMRCGEATTQPMARVRAIEMNCGQEPQPFDDGLLERWQASRAAAAEEISRKFDRSSFFANYDEYLGSRLWQEKRKKVLLRSKGLCEGCGDAEAKEIHHLSYEHVGDEFLFELVALCGACHERWHVK